MKIIGLDPSLTRTGAASIDTITGSIHTDNYETTKTGDDLASRLARFHTVTGWLRDFMPADTTLALIEGPSFGSKGAGTWDRAGLWWHIARTIIRCDIPIIEVAPAQRMMYATGKGRADKDKVMLAAQRRYPDVELGSNDEADALVIAAMGARLVGYPIEVTLPKAHVDAIAKLKLPYGWGQ